MASGDQEKDAPVGKPGRCAKAEGFDDGGAGGQPSARYCQLMAKPLQDLVGPRSAPRRCSGLLLRVANSCWGAADLLHGLDVLLIERVDDVADFLALGVSDTNRTAIDARALMIEEAQLTSFLRL